MVRIAASILGVDWLDFGTALQVCAQAKADCIQIDICDGHFVPTISFGEELVKRTHEACQLPIEVHLMVTNPLTWFERLAARGTELVIVHAEAVADLAAAEKLARAQGLKFGVALKQETDLAVLQPVLGVIDQITLMGIVPGFAGQKFIPATLAKCRAAKELLVTKQRHDVVLQVDGGVNAATAPDIAAAGATGIVTSSYMFAHQNPATAVATLRGCFATGGA